jgi:ankyrin repeat protein
MDLISACIKGDLSDLKECLKISDIDLKDFYGNSALAIAVRHGHKHIANYLIENGANTNPKNYVKLT